MVNTALITHLLQKELYDHQVLSFQVIETHTSYIILTGLYAYKIKKTVKFDFLDYSTLKKRLYYCERELTLNCDTTDNIYIAVIAIYGSITTPSFQISPMHSTPIEYAIKMHEFSQEMLLSKLLKKNLLTDQHFIELAQRVAIFHQNSERCLTGAYGNADTIHLPVHDNFTTIQSKLADCSEWLLSSSIHEKLKAVEPILTEMIKITDNWYQNHYHCFVERQKEGFIRACHGDLHLNNILLLNGKPTIFDCIEFNESLRWIDVCAEIAFLTMDVLDHNQPNLANVFLNYYLEYSGDYTALTLLPYYQCYRAMVRAKIAVLTALIHPTDSVWLEKYFHQFFHYLDLAYFLITKKQTPFIVLMHGLSGSGKSSLSNQLISQTNLIRIRSDVERKRLLNLIPHHPIPKSLKVTAYTAKHTEKTYIHLLTLATIITHANYSVLIDATFLRYCHRHMFIDLAEQKYFCWFIIATIAPHKFLVQMLKKRKDQNHEPSDATEKVISMQEKLLEPLQAQEKSHSWLLNSNEITWHTEEALLLIKQIISQFPQDN